MDAAENRLMWWWLLLVALTFVSLEGASAPGRLSGAIVLGIAFFKVRVVMRQFMEVRGAPLPLRLVLDGWIAAICGVLIVMIGWPRLLG